jgi:phage baseplate assembly protein W
MAKDILLENNDLLIINGDFVLADSEEQHIRDIIQANKGEFRENPLMGAGIQNYINAPGNNLEAFKGAVRKSLMLDNYSINSLSIEAKDGGVVINCNAFRND